MSIFRSEMSELACIDKIGETTNLDLLCEMEKRKILIAKLESKKNEDLSEVKMNEIIDLDRSGFDIFQKLNFNQIRKLYYCEGIENSMKEKLIHQLNGK